MAYYLTNTGLAKNAVVAAMALLTLSAGVFFAIKAGNNNNAIVQQWQTQDGRQKGYITGSGQTVMSGSLALANRQVGTGTLLFNTTKGGRICMPNTQGTMEEVVIVGTTLTVRSPVSNGCNYPLGNP